MPRVHEKTVKWINDRLKKEKQTKDKSERLGKAESIGKESELPSDFHQCTYCTKVFLDAKFLVNHILRRHSDKLILLHRKVLDSTTSENNKHSSSDLLNFLKTEFFSLKVELEETVRKAVTDHNHSKTDNQIKNQFASPTSEIHNCNVDLKYGKSVDDKSSQRELEESIKYVSAADFQHLQHKVEEVFQMHREAILSREDMRKTVLSEDRIYKRLKYELLSEVENMLKINNAESKKYFFELKKDMHFLEEAVELNSKNYEDGLEEIERRIKMQIQSIGSSHGMFDGKRKTSKGNSKKNLSSHSLNSYRLNRRKKSIYTCNSQPVGPHKNKNFVTSHLSPGHNKSFEKTDKISSAENSRIPYLDKVVLLVEEKLRNLNVPPHTKSMSNEEHEKKMRLLNSEREILCKNYKQFSQIYYKIDSQANKMVRSQMKGKLPKKLRFSDSPSFQPSSKGEQILMRDSIIKSDLVEKEFPGFMVQSEPLNDIYGQGDFNIAKDNVYFPVNVMRLDQSKQCILNASGDECPGILTIGNSHKSPKFPEESLKNSSTDFIPLSGTDKNLGPSCNSSKPSTSCDDLSSLESYNLDDEDS